MIEITVPHITCVFYPTILPEISQTKLDNISVSTRLYEYHGKYAICRHATSARISVAVVSMHFVDMQQKLNTLNQSEKVIVYKPPIMIMPR